MVALLRSSRPIIMPIGVPMAAPITRGTMPKTARKAKAGGPAKTGLAMLDRKTPDPRKMLLRTSPMLKAIGTMKIDHQDRSRPALTSPSKNGIVIVSRDRSMKAQAKLVTNGTTIPRTRNRRLQARLEGGSSTGRRACSPGHIASGCSLGIIIIHSFSLGRGFHRNILFLLLAYSPRLTTAAHEHCFTTQYR